MHYIRLVKSPSIETQLQLRDGSKKSKDRLSAGHASGNLEILVTVTTDLGESFYPYDAILRIEVDFHEPSEAKTSKHSQSHHITKRQKTLERPQIPAAESQSVDKDVWWQAGMRDVHMALPVPSVFENREHVGYTLTILPVPTQRPSVQAEGTMVMHSIVGMRVDSATKGEHIRLLPVFEDGKHLPSDLSNAEPEQDIHKATKLVSGSLSIPEIPTSSSNALASHVWDGGNAIAAFLPHILSLNMRQPVQDECLPLPLLARTVHTQFRNALSHGQTFRVIELGSGCAPLSNSLTTSLLEYMRVRHELGGKKGLANVEVCLTDLPEAEGTVQMATRPFMSRSRVECPEMALSFQGLDWEAVAETNELPDALREKQWGLIMASDVTYNTATLPALVRTIEALYSSPASIHGGDSATAGHSGDANEAKPLVMIARKKRHDDEDVFWTEMERAMFEIMEKARIWCPAFEGAEIGGDEGEWVEIVVFVKTAKVDSPGAARVRTSR